MPCAIFCLNFYVRINLVGYPFVYCEVAKPCALFLFNLSVLVQLYSPDRPLVDTAEVFLWLMAVGTILCASYWSAWSAREADIEQEKLLKVLKLNFV